MHARHRCWLGNVHPERPTETEDGVGHLNGDHPPVDAEEALLPLGPEVAPQSHDQLAPKKKTLFFFFTMSKMDSTERWKGVKPGEGEGGDVHKKCSSSSFSSYFSSSDIKPQRPINRIA